MPRAPSRLRAVLSSPLSASPWALKRRQSNAGPKYRLVYLRKIRS